MAAAGTSRAWHKATHACTLFTWRPCCSTAWPTASRACRVGHLAIRARVAESTVTGRERVAGARYAVTVAADLLPSRADCGSQRQVCRVGSRVAVHGHDSRPGMPGPKSTQALSCTLLCTAGLTASFVVQVGHLPAGAGFAGSTAGGHSIAGAELTAGAAWSRAVRTRGVCRHVAALVAAAQSTAGAFEGVGWACCRRLLQRTRPCLSPTAPSLSIDC